MKRSNKQVQIQADSKPRSRRQQRESKYSQSLLDFINCHCCKEVDSAQNMLTCFRPECRESFCIMCVKKTYKKYNDNFFLILKGKESSNSWRCYKCANKCPCKDCVEKKVVEEKTEKPDTQDKGNKSENEEKLLNRKRFSKTSTNKEENITPINISKPRRGNPNFGKNKNKSAKTNNNVKLVNNSNIIPHSNSNLNSGNVNNIKKRNVNTRGKNKRRNTPKASARVKKPINNTIGSDAKTEVLLDSGKKRDKIKINEFFIYEYDVTKSEAEEDNEDINNEDELESEDKIPVKGKFYNTNKGNNTYQNKINSNYKQLAPINVINILNVMNVVNVMNINLKKNMKINMSNISNISNISNTNISNISNISNKIKNTINMASPDPKLIDPINLNQFRILESEKLFQYDKLNNQCQDKLLQNESFQEVANSKARLIPVIQDKGLTPIFANLSEKPNFDNNTKPDDKIKLNSIIFTPKKPLTKPCVICNGSHYERSEIMKFFTFYEFINGIKSLMDTRLTIDTDDKKLTLSQDLNIKHYTQRDEFFHQNEKEWVALTYKFLNLEIKQENHFKRTKRFCKKCVYKKIEEERGIDVLLDAVHEEDEQAVLDIKKKEEIIRNIKEFFNTSSKDKHTNFYVKQIDSEESDTQKFNIFDNIFGKKKLTDEEINIISEAVLNKTNLQGAINSISNSQINSQNRKENDDCGGGRMLNNTIGVESNLYFLNNNSFYDNDNEENEKIGVSTNKIINDIDVSKFNQTNLNSNYHNTNVNHNQSNKKFNSSNSPKIKTKLNKTENSFNKSHSQINSKKRDENYDPDANEENNGNEGYNGNEGNNENEGNNGDEGNFGNEGYNAANQISFLLSLAYEQYNTSNSFLLFEKIIMNSIFFLLDQYTSQFSAVISMQSYLTLKILESIERFNKLKTDIYKDKEQALPNTEGALTDQENENNNKNKVNKVDESNLQNLKQTSCDEMETIQLLQQINSKSNSIVEVLKCVIHDLKIQGNIIASNDITIENIPYQNDMNIYDDSNLYN